MNRVLLCFVLVAVLWKQGDCAAVKTPEQIAWELMHEAEWASFASLSTLKESLGYPFANLKSIAQVDGVPYMILTNLEFTAKDLLNDNRIGMMISNAQNGGCKKRNLVAQDPECERILITGKAEEVKPTDDDYARAKAALIANIPSAATWLETNQISIPGMPPHRFYISKVNIEEIIVMAALRGSKKANLDSYFKLATAH